MSGLERLGLVEAKRLLARGEISSVELTRACLEAMQRHRRLNAFITETPERALAMAEAADARLARGAGGVEEGVERLGGDLQPLARLDLLEGVAGHQVPIPNSEKSPYG